MWDEKHVSLQKIVAIYLEWCLIWMMSWLILKHTPIVR